MMAAEKVETEILISLIEDELEERKTRVDRRRNDPETSKILLNGREDRRQNPDRRAASNA